MNKKIGLVLGGGGARGCAHIGVIKALEEANIKVNYISGTSIGALMGGIYSAGNINELEKFLLEVKWQDIIKYMDITFPKKGLIEGKKLTNLLEEFLTHQKIEDSKIPFTAVATDINSGEEIHMNKGYVLDAIRASVCLPGIMTPAEYKGRHLVDGGLTNPLPINVIKEQKADLIIAVDINYSYLEQKPYQPEGEKTEWYKFSRPVIIEVLQRSMLIMQNELTQKSIDQHQPDFLIRPELPAIHAMEFHKAKELIEEGYKAAQKIIPEIKKALN